MTQAVLNISRASALSHELHQLLVHTKSQAHGYDRLPEPVKEEVDEAIACLERVRDGLLGQ